MQYMRNDRKVKILSIIALVIAVVGMSLGFAAFSTTLNIAGSASVTPNSGDFSVKFSTSKDSLVVDSVSPSSKTTGLTTTDGTINNGSLPTITNLSATFTTPGQYVEYTVYVRNEGAYTAYLNNINFLGTKTCTAETGTTDSLVQSACEAITITATLGDVTYTETTPIENHSLAANAGEKMLIRLEYSSEGARADGAFSIKFPDIAVVYSTVDDSSIEPTKPQVTTIVSGDLDTIGSVVAIGDEEFYVYGTEGDNVKLLSRYNLYVGGVYNSGWTAYGSEATGRQNSTMLGWTSAGRPHNGTTAFSNDDQKGTNYSDYSGSIVEGYVNSYESYLIGLGVNISEARLITKDELVTLGCSEEDYSCSSAPSFVYSTSYWSGSANDAYSVWFVDRDANFGDSSYDDDHGAGVRPVIIISKSEF